MIAFDKETKEALNANAPQAQLQILNKILQTGDYSIITSNNITEDFFPDYRAEFNYISNHYKTFGAVPDKFTFANVYNDFNMFAVNEPDSFLVNSLIVNKNTTSVVDSVNKVRENFGNGDFITGIQALEDGMAKIHTGTALTTVDLLSDTSRYDRYLERSVDRTKYYISTGFPEIDKMIGGIDRENENLVICARTGVGKTWSLLKMAVEASRQGLVTGIYSGEMSADKVGYRIDTLIGHMKNTAINHGDLFVQKEYKRYMDSISSLNYGPIKVLEPKNINGPATVSALRSFIEKEKLDILFIDQYSLLEDEEKAKAANERIANISKAIKNLQVMARIPIISVCQMNRTKNDDGSLDTTQIGLSDRIGQDATVILMLDNDKKSVTNDERYVTYHIVKSRDGGDNKKITYAINWNVGSFELVPSEDDGITDEATLDEIGKSYEPVSEELF